MADRGDLEALFLAHRDLVGRIAAAAGRRQGLRGDDLDDFASWAVARLIEGDYAVLAQFRGESSLATYLTVVVTMLAREYRVRHWGRWRPSAAARRQGPLAVRLETMVYRDGVRLDEAAQALRTAGLTSLSDRALAAILAACPARPPSRPDRATAADDGPPVELVPGDSATDGALLDQEADDERRSVGARLADAVDALPAEERVMVRLRYWQGLSVADVARALGVPQKPLYRRLERVLAGLRAELERRGVERAQVYAMLGEPLPGGAHHGHQPDDPLPISPVHARVGDARSPPAGDSTSAQPSI